MTTGYLQSETKRSFEVGAFAAGVLAALCPVGGALLASDSPAVGIVVGLVIAAPILFGAAWCWLRAHPPVATSLRLTAPFVEGRRGDGIDVWLSGCTRDRSAPARGRGSGRRSRRSLWPDRRVELPIFVTP